MFDREVLLNRFVDGDGSAAFSLREWLSLHYVDRSHHNRVDFLGEECCRLRKTTEELLAVADLTTVYAEARFIGPQKRREFYVTAWIYEIQDTPAPDNKPPFRTPEPSISAPETGIVDG